MLEALQNALETIANILKKTTAAKKTWLEDLQRKLKVVVTYGNLKEEYLTKVTNCCRNALLDPEFTYKQISLWGLLSSRSEDVAREVLEILERQKVWLFVEKLEAHYTASHPIVKCIREHIQSRDFLSALSLMPQLDTINDRFAPIDSIKWLDEYLQRKVELKMSADYLTDMYSPTRWPFAEIQAAQRVYDWNEVKEIMAKKSRTENVSLIYGIDKHGNVVFSFDAENSFHINLLKGDPVYGAGELVIKKTANKGIALISVNNRSGLYMPSFECTLFMRDWLNKLNVDVSKAQVHDLREEMASSFAQDRAMR